MTDLSNIIDDYAMHHRRHEHVELEYFRRRGSLEDAVSQAALARLQGKKLSHQWRLKEQVLTESRDRLIDNLAALRRAETFDDLHDTIEAVVSPINGMGVLTVYDTAIRIGAHRGLLPTKVYLHAGTRIGARNLGLAWRARTLEMNALPRSLRRLPPHEVEDILCIYKDVFAMAAGLLASAATCGLRSSSRCAPKVAAPAVGASCR